ncbi:hypothetical protein HYPSUDRAFT_209525 [Hypholoma sublateritium FD-334 SS-4]|uniref:Uncharacterized protein n=1 Tax=Hypholoma sublateritium (strain FD-334 SS-4) TaxID=945553 RepID=A0A0D2NYB1_HYPSF|nr:hypothetical protein HYPSUDRAFT_209525 [Hypholoma sublateritium FD-334 SS-4]
MLSQAENCLSRLNPEILSLRSNEILIHSAIHSPRPSLQFNRKNLDRVPSELVSVHTTPQTTTAEMPLASPVIDVSEQLMLLSPSDRDATAQDAQILSGHTAKIRAAHGLLPHRSAHMIDLSGADLHAVLDAPFTASPVSSAALVHPASNNVDIETGTMMRA